MAAPKPKVAIPKDYDYILEHFKHEGPRELMDFKNPNDGMKEKKS